MRRSFIPNEMAEREAYVAGHQVVVGIDEVGRGAWAGPLVVGAVILPPNRRLLRLRDSKLLLRSERDQLASRVKRVATSWSIGVVDVRELDEVGLGVALGIAAKRALDGLSVMPTLCLVDGKYPLRSLEIEQQPIIKGDTSVRCIAAASVIAKVERDRMMRTLHRSDLRARPYRFDLNKGYPSSLHQQRLGIHGASPFHRTSFAPIRALLEVHS